MNCSNSNLSICYIIIHVYLNFEGVWCIYFALILFDSDQLENLVDITLFSDTLI